MDGGNLALNGRLAGIGSAAKNMASGNPTLEDGREQIWNMCRRASAHRARGRFGCSRADCIRLDIDQAAVHRLELSRRSIRRSGSCRNSALAAQGGGFVAGEDGFASLDESTYVRNRLVTLKLHSLNNRLNDAPLTHRGALGGTMYEGPRPIRPMLGSLDCFDRRRSYYLHGNRINDCQWHGAGVRMAIFYLTDTLRHTI